MSRWINTKAVFEWNGEKYIEKYSEGYFYNGELSLCLDGGASGAAGGSASVTRAITRLEVLDPHVVILMRDVMDSSETAPRLKVQAGAAGGGGGGGGGAAGGEFGSDPGGEGYPRAASMPPAVSPAILKGDSAAGGTGGQGQAGVSNRGGGGGGGAGGDGGAIVIITTSSSVGTTSVTRGTYGGGGASWGGVGNGSNGSYGQHGKLFHIRV